MDASPTDLIFMQPFPYRALCAQPTNSCFRQPAKVVALVTPSGRFYPIQALIGLFRSDYISNLLLSFRLGQIRAVQLDSIRSLWRIRKCGRVFALNRGDEDAVPKHIKPNRQLILCALDNRIHPMEKQIRCQVPRGVRRRIRRK
ncbi:unnamed protein product [Strongylus vulgaris]|uniref:Uncharacterized protein n=1 Tax=Strongylus vulgaris TaxID=40348 RepID=A0A3P7IZ77_STRVU|nr:unnamed protein product [Strongylus vulgaris]